MKQVFHTFFSELELALQVVSFKDSDVEKVKMTRLGSWIDGSPVPTRLAGALLSSRVPAWIISSDPNLRLNDSKISTLKPIEASPAV